VWCTPFDEALAAWGPAAIFLLDREGRWRFAQRWTLDAWARHPDPGPRRLSYWLARDLGSGFVLPLLCTAPGLLEAHPRLAFREVAGPEALQEALTELGRPPVRRDPW
jgi:hypothetical protein